ncbi:MAG: serine/threonine-protein kinase [Bacteroidota bacterium]
MHRFNNGEEIDGYRIQGVLGQGGMGVVYRAEDVALSREVALKVIDPALARNEAFVRRFRSEAKALARIHSPHIVGIHAMRQAQGTMFIVMECVNGGTLKDPMANGAIPWKQAMPTILQMLRAFEQAHDVGVIHRDIKPSNIMLTEDGTVKVTDFGLARIHDPGADVTRTQGVAGTLFYMSPEQAKGAMDLDHRSDLYSLGMTIYEMLAGTLPFDRRSSEYTIMKTIVEGTVPPLEKQNPNVPRDLAKIVMKSLEKDPGRRYASAAEMRKAFEGFVASQGATVDGSKPSSSRLVPILSVIGALVLAVGAVLIWRTLAPDALDAPTALTITSSPEGADVFIEGERRGQTPYTDTTLAAGPVTFRVEREGYLAETGEIDIVEGVSELVRVDLRSARTMLSIDSQPSDAEVYLDGAFVGNTPFEDTTLAAGDVRVRLSRDGYVDVEEFVTIVPGERIAINPLLTREQTTRPPTVADDTPAVRPPADRPPDTAPAMAQLMVQVEPRSLTGAVSVSVDGTGTSQAGQRRVPVGTREVRCSHPIYGVATTTASFQAGGSTTLTCYYQREVRLSAADNRGAFAVNYEVRNKATGDVVFATETRTDSVRDLYLPAGSYEITADRNSPDIRVEDNVRTIEIRPSFQQPDFLRVRFTVTSL